jgi:hypothetical protein
MKNHWKIGCSAAAGASVLLAGLACRDITGKWALSKVEPSIARPAFDYEVLTLQEDGTFYGEVRGIGTVSGTYFYDEGNLVLQTRDGMSHVYRVDFDEAGRELELKNVFDRDLKAVLVKTEENKPVED